VDVHKTLRETEQMLRPAGGHISIKLDLNAENSVVLGDESQVQSVFLNLGVNARDAMPGGGELTFRTRDAAEGAAGPGLNVRGFIRIDVVDTGTGIDEKIIGKIFEPLFTTKPKGVGTGLGLPSVLYCVKNMRGLVEVDSAPGEGAVFKVTLPLYRGEGGEKAGLGGKRVLVVTEDAGLAESLGGRLATEGIEAARVAEPEAALDLIRDGTGKTAAVVIDYDTRNYDARGFENAVNAAAPGMLVIKILSTERVALGSNKNYLAFADVPTDSEMFFESLAMYMRDSASEAL
jgi:hypothetical protein